MDFDLLVMRLKFTGTMTTKRRPRMTTKTGTTTTQSSRTRKTWAQTRFPIRLKNVKATWSICARVPRLRRCRILVRELIRNTTVLECVIQMDWPEQAGIAITVPTAKSFITKFCCWSLGKVRRTMRASTSCREMWRRNIIGGSRISRLTVAVHCLKSSFKATRYDRCYTLVDVESSAGGVFRRSWRHDLWPKHAFRVNNLTVIKA